MIDILHNIVNSSPNKIAICSNSESINYQTLIHKIEKRAIYFLENEIDKNCVVGLTIKNEIEHLIITLSLLHLNIPHIVLASFDSTEIHKDAIHRLNITHILKDPVNEISQDSVFIDIINSAYKNKSNHISMFLKTSGTTGKAKIIAFSKDQILHQSHAYDWFKQERLMTLASIEHNNARRHRLFCLFAGGTNVFLENNNNTLETVKKHNVNLISGSHLHAANLLKLDGKEYLHGTKLLFSGSKIPSSMLLKIAQTITPDLIIGYGSTETGAISFTKLGNVHDNESVGFPINGTEVEIVDINENTPKLPVSGEIRVRSKGMATHYYDDSKQTLLRFKDGWFITGDIGFMKPDGQLVIKNRKDDMFILNGINVFPSEIEEVLETHEDIISSAVVGIESLNHGSIPVAAIEINNKASKDVKQYMTFARQKLMLRAPRRIIIVESLPRNAQGKIEKNNVKLLFINN